MIRLMASLIIAIAAAASYPLQAAATAWDDALAQSTHQIYGGTAYAGAMAAFDDHDGDLEKATSFGELVVGDPDCPTLEAHVYLTAWLRMPYTAPGSDLVTTNAARYVPERLHHQV